MIQKKWPLDFFNTVDSTNTEIIRQLAHGRVPPFSLIAKQQTAGRGRYGKKWISPYGNIYYSLATIIKKNKLYNCLHLVIGLSVLNSLKIIGLENLGLKWPNDIFHKGKKIAGILIELIEQSINFQCIVIGIGINVDITLSNMINKKCTSLSNTLGKVNKFQLIYILEKQIHFYLKKYSNFGFESIHNELKYFNILQGYKVCCISNTHPNRKSITGTVLGINNKGDLCLDVNGNLQNFNIANFSLRLYDYT